MHMWQAVLGLIMSIFGLVYHFSTRNERPGKPYRKIVKPVFEEPRPHSSKSPLQDAKKSEGENTRIHRPLFSDIPDISLPPLHLLDQLESGDIAFSKDTLDHIAQLIEKKLEEFGVQVKVVAAYPGPAITRYEIDPTAGVRGRQITRVARDLSRALSVPGIQVQETLPGKPYMALDLFNPKRQAVRLFDLLSSQDYAMSHAQLTIAIGKDTFGKPVVADIEKMPHMLVAGTTGSGKSIAIDAMILSLLYKVSPKQVRLLLIDPKGVALSVYNDIPHLLSPVITDMSEAGAILNWCVQEMHIRNRLLSHFGLRNIADFNQKARDAINSERGLNNPFSLTPENPEPLGELPSIVIFIDGLSDLMKLGQKVAELIESLAKGAAVTGIHLIMTASRLSTEVLTSQIKASVPARMAFQVASKVDSLTILDQIGAEALSQQGDMLYLISGIKVPQHVYGTIVSDEEVSRVVEYLKAQGKPNYIVDMQSLDVVVSGENDPMYEQAVEIVLKTRRASISLVQRHLRIGYNRAAMLIENMERAGLVSSMKSDGSREVLGPSR